MLFAAYWKGFDAAVEAWPEAERETAGELAAGAWRNAEGLSLPRPVDGLLRLDGG